ncbi:MAG: hypothetical protein PHC34_02235 [Candidatus Gastranaerophilales bacterium]|nr:hypothetical protein [Candidatus Gastranaerophilales bacterium]
MKIVNRQFELDKPKKLTVDIIENALTQSGEIPIRWSVVKIHNNKIIVDAVLFK